MCVTIRSETPLTHFVYSSTYECDTKPSVPQDTLTLTLMSLLKSSKVTDLHKALVSSIIIISKEVADEILTL